MNLHKLELQLLLHLNCSNRISRWMDKTYVVQFVLGLLYLNRIEMKWWVESPAGAVKGSDESSEVCSLRAPVMIRWLQLWLICDDYFYGSAFNLGLFRTSLQSHSFIHSTWRVSLVWWVVSWWPAVSRQESFWQGSSADWQISTFGTSTLIILLSWYSCCTHILPQYF